MYAMPKCLQYDVTGDDTICNQEWYVNISQWFLLGNIQMLASKKLFPKKDRPPGLALILVLCTNTFNMMKLVMLRDVIESGIPKCWFILEASKGP